MRRRPPQGLELRKNDYRYLAALVRSGRTEPRVAHRARTLLAMADPGTVVQDLAERVGQARNTLWQGCRRSEAMGVEAVFAAPRSGRPWAIAPPAAGRDRTAGLL